MPVEPPQNSEYLIAGYVVTAAILIGYWIALFRRAKRNSSAPPPA